MVRVGEEFNDQAKKRRINATVKGHRILLEQAEKVFSGEVRFIFHNGLIKKLKKVIVNEIE